MRGSQRRPWRSRMQNVPSALTLSTPRLAPSSGAAPSARAATFCTRRAPARCPSPSARSADAPSTPCSRSRRCSPTLPAGSAPWTRVARPRGTPRGFRGRRLSRRCWRSFPWSSARWRRSSTGGGTGGPRRARRPRKESCATRRSRRQTAACWRWRVRSSRGGSEWLRAAQQSPTSPRRGCAGSTTLTRRAPGDSRRRRSCGG
mmetsp:Transcript_39662/g.119838  ORF Transcript_39662/g.119838 Transcript_39662/m.119838 type:complete len:203 (+) Transcript_39662:790-1398(+)